MVEFEDQDWSKATVIGFVDNPKPCGEYALFEIYLNATPAEIKRVAIVWNVQEGTLVMGPVDADEDPEYLLWVGGATSIGADMLSIGEVCGKIIPSAGPSSCELITDGLIDSYPNPDYDIKAAGPDDFYIQDLMPESKQYSVLLPESPTPYAGFRTQSIFTHSVVMSLWDDEVRHYLSPGWSETTRSYRFNGPLGQLALWDGYSYGSGDNQYGIYAWGETESLLPRWAPRQGGVTQYWPDNMKWAYARPWYTSDLKAQFSDRSIVDITMVQFTSCDYIYNRPGTIDGTAVVSASWTFLDRQIYIHAQALDCQTGTTGKDWVSAGRNATLEAKLIEAVRCCYALNSIPDPEIRDCKIAVSILRGGSTVIDPTKVPGYQGFAGFCADNPTDPIVTNTSTSTIVTD